MSLPPRPVLKCKSPTCDDLAIYRVSIMAKRDGRLVEMRLMSLCPWCADRAMEIARDTGLEVEVETLTESEVTT